MRIEVNLLPGAKRGKKKKGGSMAADFKALWGSIQARFKDVWLATAIGAGVVAALAIALLFMTQRTREAGLASTLDKVVADSARYAAVLADRARAEARRDSALLQLNIIKAIDEDRFIWPHILDEISRALPPYTWLVSVKLSGTAQGTNPAAAYRPPPPDTSKGKRRRSVAIELPRDTVRFQVIGQTVDIQAFTRFYSALEDSPFLGGVTFSKTEEKIQGGKPIREFVLDVSYTRPDSSLLRRTALTVTPPTSPTPR